MDSFKANVLQLLSSTGYILKLKPESLNFVDSPVTCWFNQNISEENCITEEELSEFKSLQEEGVVLYGEDLEEALQEYYDTSAVVPVIEALEDIKNDEVEHAQHQLDLQKQLVSVLRSSLNSIENDCLDLKNTVHKAEAEQMCVLKDLMAANSEYNSKLNLVKETLTTLVNDIIELAPNQELSADEGIDTCSSDKLKSSALSNSSIISSVSTFSTKKVENDAKYLSQMSFHKYNKQHTSFCKLLKDVLQKGLSKMQQNGSRPHCQLLVQNIVDRLYHQNQKYTKLTAELAGINYARNRIKDVEREIRSHLWKPTHSELRTKITELQNCNVLNESETSIDNDEKELIELCKKSADIQILKPICDTLKERIEWSQLMLQKLDELASIMSMRLAIDNQLYETIFFENDLVLNIMEVINKVHDSLQLKIEASKSRMKVMKENLQDYNEHVFEARREFLEYLAAALDCNRAEIPEAFKLLTGQSINHHQETVLSYRQQLKILASVHKDLNDFYFEEEKKRLERQRMSRNQDHFDSVRQMLELISHEIEHASMLCHTMLECKENVIQN